MNMPVIGSVGVGIDRRLVGNVQHNVQAYQRHMVKIWGEQTYDQVEVVEYWFTDIKSSYSTASSLSSERRCIQPGLYHKDPRLKITNINTSILTALLTTINERNGPSVLSAATARAEPKIDSRLRDPSKPRCFAALLNDICRLRSPLVNCEVGVPPV